MDMVTFIASRIENGAEKSIERGQTLYRAYFITVSLYRKYKTDVDAILVQDGYEDVIVEE